MRIVGIAVLLALVFMVLAAPFASTVEAKPCPDLVYKCLPDRSSCS